MVAIGVDGRGRQGGGSLALPLAILGLLGCGRSDPPESAASARPASTPPPLAEPRDLLSPAGPGSGEPNLAVAADGRIFLSWIESGDDDSHELRFAERRQGGPWSPARRIARGRHWFVNWADFPAVLALPDGTLVAHWLARSGPGRYAYDVRVAISRDGGQRWTGGVVPHRDGTSTEHGFVSLFPAGDRAGLIWLDGRRTAGGSADGHGGEMALMHTTLAADGTLGPETVLDERVCDCCQTAAVATDEGVVVAYRDRSPPKSATSRSFASPVAGGRRRRCWVRTVGRSTAAR